MALTNLRLHKAPELLLFFTGRENLSFKMRNKRIKGEIVLRTIEKREKKSVQIREYIGWKREEAVTCWLMALIVVEKERISFTSLYHNYLRRKKTTYKLGKASSVATETVNRIRQVIVTVNWDGLDCKKKLQSDFIRYTIQNHNQQREK